MIIAYGSKYAQVVTLIYFRDLLACTDGAPALIWNTAAGYLLWT